MLFKTLWRGARAPSQTAYHGVRPPFHLRLLGVGELHGDLELGGGVGVGVPGDHLRGGGGKTWERRERKEQKPKEK